MLSILYKFYTNTNITSYHSISDEFKIQFNIVIKWITYSKLLLKFYCSKWFEISLKFLFSKFYSKEKKRNGRY